MVVSTRSARATVREGSTSPPRDPRGPPGIPMPDDGVEGARLPPPPPVRIGLGGPTSPRPDPPSPHMSASVRRPPPALLFDGNPFTSNPQSDAIAFCVIFRCHDRLRPLELKIAFCVIFLHLLPSRRTTPIHPHPSDIHPPPFPVGFCTQTATGSAVGRESVYIKPAE